MCQTTDHLNLQVLLTLLGVPNESAILTFKLDFSPDHSAALPLHHDRPIFSPKKSPIALSTPHPLLPLPTVSVSSPPNLYMNNLP
jgi:hypothetical protein